MDLNIKFDLQGIGTVLNRYRIVVPSNQREYSWEAKDQVAQLLRDLSKAMREPGAAYFLGTIVFTQIKPETYYVADGQQRLATATMILAAIRDLFLARGDKLMVERIDNNFLSTIDSEANERVSRFTLNTDDDMLFRNDVLVHPGERVSIKATRRSHDLIRDAKNRILEHFSALEKQVGIANFRDVLKDWMHYLEKRATVLVLNVSDESNAFVLFETLNARGLKTSQADLVKNYLFKESGDRVNEAQAQWSLMRGAIETVADDEDLTLDFLRLAYCVQCGPTRERDVMDRVQNLVKSKTEAIRQLHLLAELACDYAAILNDDHPKWSDYTDDVRRSIRAITFLGVTQIRPLMLAVARYFRPADANTAFRRMVAWSVRFLIVGGRGGKLDFGYAQLANAIHGNEIRTAGALNERALSDFVPSDGAFRGSFETARVSVNKLARYYLRALEVTARNQPNPEWVPNDGVEVNLEHIMPDTYSVGSVWGNQQDTETHARRLGNLVLLQANKNSEVGQSDFATKRTVYGNSTFLLTSQVAGKRKWGKAEIEARQKKLAELAVKTWPLD